MSAWLSVWLPFVRSFENNIISHFWFCLPFPEKQSANRCSAIQWSIDKTLLRVRLCSTEFGNRTIPFRIGRISERSIRYLLFCSIVVLQKTQCANRCFSKIFETIFLPRLSLRFQVQWKLPFPNFLFHPEHFEVLFFLLLLFLFSIHCCWKSLSLYCVNWIEFILRDVTGCHSFEFLIAIGNKESRIILFRTFGFVYPPP